MKAKIVQYFCVRIKALQLAAIANMHKPRSIFLNAIDLMRWFCIPLEPAKKLFRFSSLNPIILLKYRFSIGFKVLMSISIGLQVYPRFDSKKKYLYYMPLRSIGQF